MNTRRRTTSADALTKEEIDDLADRWYKALDVHAPVEALHAMMTEARATTWRGRRAPTHGHAEFTVWYEKVTRRFFDEVHTIKKVEPTIDGDTADVKVVVNWKASVWEPPAPKSITLHMDAFQTWEVVRSPESGKALINALRRRLASRRCRTPTAASASTRATSSIAYYRSANAGDWQTWLTLFKEDVVIDEQLAGHVEGLDILRGAIGGMEKGYSRFQNVPKRHRRARATRPRSSRTSPRANAAGEPIEAEVANYFRLEDGKIAYMANIHDTVPFDRRS